MDLGQGMASIMKSYGTQFKELAEKMARTTAILLKQG
jgi:hypothetical protein